MSFSFDGKQLEGYEGEPIAAALHANGVKVYRETPVRHQPRGFFCAIGKCSSCFMVVDGVSNVRTCATSLEEGMRVETQRGKGVVLQEARVVAASQSQGVQKHGRDDVIAVPVLRWVCRTERFRFDAASRLEILFSQRHSRT